MREYKRGRHGNLKVKRKGQSIVLCVVHIHIKFNKNLRELFFRILRIYQLLCTLHVLINK